MAVFGNRPEDVVQDRQGNALSGVKITVHTTEADATSGVNPLATATTDSKGRWPVTVAGKVVVWARDPSGSVWQVADDAAMDAAKLDVTAASDTYGPKSVAPVRALDYCVGDGVADDTAALQSALNAAVNSGRALEIKGRIRTTGPLVLSTTKPVAIRAAGVDVNPFGTLAENVASIESSGAAVFTAADTGSVIIDLQGVNFRNTNGGIVTSLFDTVNLSESRIAGITTGNYNHVFKGGDLGGVSRVTGNRFLTVKTVFCSASLTDAIVSENYINGSTSTNSTVFTGNWANSLFMGNYVDFFKRVFDLPNGAMADVRVIGNLFDYVWCTVGTSAAAFLSSFTIVGNTWFHCTAAEANAIFTAEDADMTGTPYRAIDASAGLNRTVITGNHFIGVSQAIRLRGGVNNIVESGNVYDDTTPANRVDFGGDWPSSGVRLEALEYARFAPTFAAAQTVNWASGAIAVITLTANMTSLGPVNATGDQVYELHLVQDATGGRTLAGASAKFKWAGGVAPTLSTGAGRRDIFRFRYRAPDDAYDEISRSMNVG